MQSNATNIMDQPNLVKPGNRMTTCLNNACTLLSAFLKKVNVFSRKRALPFGILMAFLLSGIVAMAQTCPAMVEGTVASTSNSLLCSGQTSNINITVTPTSGGTYSGTFTNGRSFGPLTPASGIISPSYTFTNNTQTNVTENFVLATLKFFPTGSPSGFPGCNATALSGSKNITIQPVADINATLTTPSNLCNNGSVSITVSNPNGVGGTYNRSANYGAAGHTASTTATGQAYGTFTDMLTNSTASPVMVVYTFTPISPGTLNCVGTPVSVTVTINPNPTVVCPANKTVGTDAGVCIAVVTGIDPVSFSPATCNGVAPTITYSATGMTTFTGTGSASGKIFNKGTTTVTYNIKDAANNIGTPCSFTVTVVDDKAPVIATCPSNITRPNDVNQCSAVVTFPTPPANTAADNCGGTVTYSFSPASGSTFPVGTTTVTFTATDNATPANSSTCTFTVKVNDTQAPTISCPANITVNNANDNCGAVVNFAATPSDNCSAVAAYTIPGTPNPIPITSPYTFPVGTTTVTATAKDTTGNTSAPCTFIVTVVNVGGIYVNDVFTMGSDVYTTAAGNDMSGTGTKCAPFATITKAISVASATDTIYVDGGSYTENLTINKNITFRGANASTAGTATRIAESVLNAPTTGSNQLLSLSGSGVKAIFDGFKFDGKNIGAINDGTQKLYIRNTIAELDFSPTYNNLNFAGDSLVLTNNLFKAQDGMDDGSSSHIFSGSKLVAKGNTFTSVDAVDQLTGSTTSLPVWLNISAGTQYAAVDSNLFTTIDIGVLLADNASNVTVSNNDFVNAKRNTYVPGNGFGTGIALFQTLTGTGNSINNNNFTNSETGIRSSVAGAGPYALPTGLAINRNSFTNISDTAIRLSSAFTGTLNAECNWFGTIGAGAIDATTSNQVDFTPYLLNGTDNSTARGFQTTATCGTANDLYVNDGSPTGDRYTTAIGNDATGSGTPSAPFLTIQKAISVAASGDSIYVDAGTYTGFMAVNKTVSLTGAQVGVDPRPTGTAVRPGMFGESIVLPSAVDTTNAGGTLFTLSANNIAFNGFTFSGNNPALTGGQPVNGVNIQASRVLVNQQSPIKAITGLGFKNNIVKNFYRSGVYLFGVGPSAPQQNNVIDKNVFDNIHRLNDTATAVYMEQESTSDVTNNLMTRVGLGAYTATISGNATVPFSLSNNNITSYFTGIWVNNHSGATPVCTVAGNTLATEAGALSNDGLQITSMLTSAQVLVSNNNITASRNGYYLWNCPTTNTITITGGTVNGGRRGVFATNFYPGFGNAASSTYNVNNVTIQNSSFAGINVDDSAANTNSATVAVNISGGTQISNANTGLLIEGGSANALFSGTSPAASFTGTNTKYIQLQSNGTDVPAGGIDATAVLFDGQTGATASATQNFVIEDKIDHRIDSLPLGFITVKAANAFVTDIAPLAPTATNNDYTRIRNAVATISSNWTINNNGTFDWSEPNAAAAWALGNDGVAGVPATPNGVPDDYSILIPDNRTGVTFTAPLGLGTATIQGPGDLAAVNMEMVLYFSGSNYQNWTISNMKFLDFDWTLGMFTFIDGNNYGNLKIINNMFRLPADLTSDASLNVGIRLSLGFNQEVSNNTFEIAGDGVSNGTNYSRTDAIQTNFRDGGMQFDGLKIKNNTFTVTGLPSADPAVMRTVFENCSNTGAAMELSGNVFSNADPANTASINRQTAFWISSQSQGSKKIEYKNNEIKGFRDGLAWVGGAFSSGNSPVYNANEGPVEIMNNKFDSTLYGVVVRKAPSSTNPGSPGIINFNSFTNIRPGGYAIGNESTAADTTAATCNWYGTTSANTIATLISGKVAYTPYLINGTDTSAATGFQPNNNSCTGTPVVTASTVPSPQTCTGNGSITVTFSGGTSPYSLTYTGPSSGGPTTVASPALISGLAAGSYTVTITDANGSFATAMATITNNQVRNVTQNITYTTIQAAVTAANANDSITVCSTTYNEQVVINKALKLQGLGATKPIINYTGTPANTARRTLFDVSVPSVTIRGFEFQVNANQLGSAIIASGANVSNLTVDTNVIRPYGTLPIIAPELRNAIAINYGDVLRVNGANPVNILARGNTITYFDNGTPSGSDDVGFRSGFAMDEATGTFVGNTIQSIEQDIQSRFAGAGSLVISNNNINGGGVEIAEHNAGSGTFTVSGNIFNGTFGSTYTSALRLKNNLNNKATTVSGNTFTGHNRGISLENYRSVTINNNVFTPATGSITYRHITVNTKESSSSSGTFTPNINGTFTNNTFNASSATGGLGLAFYNQDNDSPVFGTFTIGTSGNENNFNAGIGTFIYLDNNAGTTNPNNTPTAPFPVNLSAINNKFDVGTGLQLPSAMSLANLFLLENKIQHKIDTTTLGFVLVKANNTYVTPNSFIAPSTEAKIQRGVDAAGPTGFTENVQNGTYRDNVIVNKEITITGQSQAGVIVVPATSNPNCGGAGGGSLCGGTSSNVFLVQANNVTIQTLTADGNNSALTGTTVNGVDVDARNGIITDHNTVAVVTGLNVNNVTVKNIFFRGIYASTDNGTFNFNANTVTNVAGLAGESFGILNFGGSGTITNNTVTNSFAGVGTQNSFGTTFSGNTITDCIRGIEADNSGAAAGSAADVVTNNIVTNTGTGVANSFGITVFNPYVAPTVQENTVTNVQTGLANIAQVVAVTPVFTRNTINGNNRANSIGVLQTTDRTPFGSSNVSGTFTNNFIQNNTVGFKVEYQSTYTSNITANNNSITGNVTGVQLITGGTLTNSFTCNWWGASDAPTVAMKVGPQANLVNYIPYLNSGAETDPTPGFQPTANCVACTTLSGTVTQTATTCANASNGELTVTVNNPQGIMPYSYVITSGPTINTTGASSGVFTGLSQGTYTITVVMATGCSTALAPAVVRDQVAPIFTVCPAPVTGQTPNTANCQASVDPPDPTATDNCTTPSITYTLSGATVNNVPAPAPIGAMNFNVGTTTITYTATDQSGNIATCSTSVTVVNNLKDSISGTVVVAQNSNTTSNITFYANGGTGPYTFTYNINGGPNQMVSTTGSNSTVTVPQSNGVVGQHIYTLVSGTDVYGCAAAIASDNKDTITVTATSNRPDFIVEVSRPFNTTFTAGQVRDGYITISNVATVPSTGQITFRISNTNNFMLSFPSGNTTPNNGFTINNTDWTITPGDFFYTVTSKPNVVINGGAFSRVGFVMTATGSRGSQGIMTVTIPNDTGGSSVGAGDSNNSNNQSVVIFAIN